MPAAGMMEQDRLLSQAAMVGLAGDIGRITKDLTYSSDASTRKMGVVLEHCEGIKILTPASILRFENEPVVGHRSTEALAKALL